MSYAQSDEYVFRIEPRNRERLDDDFVRTFAGQQPEWGPLGYVTFKRTYARRLTDEQRAFRDLCGQRHAATSTEEFYESIRRVTEGTFSVLRQQIRQSGQRWDEVEAQAKMQTMFGLMWNFKFLPPGRGLGNMGAEVVEKKGAACLLNCGFRSTANIDLDFAAPFTMLMDFSMLGIGMGFDVLGAGKVTLVRAVRNDDLHEVSDTREGWCAALARVLNAFVGLDTLPGCWDFSKVRPEGAIIHTFGGTASGPGPLRELLEGVESILAAGAGEKITSTTIADVMNLIGRCVVAGNVRRSAEIALGDPADPAFVALKDPTELGALYDRRDLIAADIPEWRASQGEIKHLLGQQSGLSVLDPVYLALQRRIEEFKKAQSRACRANEAWAELDAKIEAHPLRKYRWASNNTVMCGLEQDYSALAAQTARNGEPGYAWIDVMRSHGRLSDPPSDADKKAAGTNPCVPAGTRVLTREGYVAIEKLVGGTVDVWNGEAWAPVTPRVTGRDQPMVRVDLSDGTSLVCTRAHEWVLSSREPSKAEWRLAAQDLRPGMRLANFEMPRAETPEALREFAAGFNALFARCGKAEGGEIVLSLGHCVAARETRLWLTQYGVQASVRGDVVTIDEREIRRVSTLLGRELTLAVPPTESDPKERCVTVVSVTDAGVAPVVYCFTEPRTHRGTFEGVVTAQCGEQTLWDGETCNLVETFPTNHASLEDFKHTLKYAYLFAKVVTCVRTHNETTNAVSASNRRIGLSMAGIWELYETLGLRECVRWWREGYAYIRELDNEYSGWMSVGRSIKVTSVKPGGTIPLLANREGGMKLPISRFYMRTIRIEENSPLARSIADAGYRVEPCLSTPRTVVAYFPRKETKAKRVAREVSIWEQCALFTALQRDWADNQVSATITFKPEEAGEIERVLDVHTGQWKSVSFMPLFDHQFRQAPYIPCSEAEYEAAIAAVKPLVLDGDVHDSEEKFCSGDKCEIVIP